MGEEFSPIIHSKHAEKAAQHQRTYAGGIVRIGAATIIAASLGGTIRTSRATMYQADTRTSHLTPFKDSFEPTAESLEIIREIYRLYGTDIILSSQWDSNQSRLALEPASAQTLRIIADGFQHMKYLETILKNAYPASPEGPSIFPAELKVYTLKGLDGTPGGGYGNNAMSLIIPGALELDGAAPPDKDGIRRKELGSDLVIHTVKHEITHRLAEMYPWIFYDYTDRFWKSHRDGTWSPKDRAHATGYAGDPHPAEFFADICALSSSRFGYSMLDAQSQIFIMSSPELREWVQDMTQDSNHQSNTHAIHLPRGAR